MASKIFLTTLVAMTTCVLSDNPDQGSNCDVMGILETLQEQNKELVRKVNQLEVLQQKNALLEQKVGRLEDQLASLAMTANVDSLFLATISAESISISTEEPIIFDSAPINPGGHFNTILGAYTAPYTGYYQFSVTKRSDNYRSYFWLLVDEQRYLYNYLYTSDATAPTGSLTINIELTAGQIVRVENQSSSLVFGTSPEGIIQSWFTGFLLYSLN